VSDLFEEPDDATPLTPEERRELIPAHIAYRSELNEAEQENIGRAQDWALGRRRDLLSEKFIKDLHRHMLGDVWRWAGRFRTSERNLGIAHYEIPVTLYVSSSVSTEGVDVTATRMGRRSFRTD
jgi:fido (protein-threonine AMPylation protein)